MHRWIARARIVIAAHQRHRNACVSSAPMRECFDRRSRLSLARMQEVAEEDDVLDLPSRDQRIES